MGGKKSGLPGGELALYCRFPSRWRPFKMRIWLGLLLALITVPALANEIKSDTEAQSTSEADIDRYTNLVNTAHLVNKTDLANKTTGEPMTIWIDVRTA